MAYRRLALFAFLLAGLAACAPRAVRLDAVPESWAEYEGREVVLPGPLTIVDAYRLATDGEVEVSLTGRQFQSTEIHPPGPAAAALAQANRRARATLDLDTVLASEPPNPARPWRLGTQLRDVSGKVVRVGEDYRLDVTALPRIEQAPRPAAPPAVGGDLVLASFNLLGFFNGDGAGGGFPTARGAATADAFAHQRDKLLATLVALDADVLALNELENDGYGPQSAIAQLCDTLNARLGEADHYRYIVPPVERLGGDAIAVGMIYRPGRVQPQGAAATLQTGSFAWGNRAPLLQRFVPISGAGGFAVVVNHLKSKSSCPASGNEANADLGDGQGCWNALRTAAAAELADWIASTTTGEDVLLLGDLNAHGQEDPLRAFRARGFTDVLALHADGKPQYSFVFKGLSGRLDHALASPGLAARTTGAAEWHVNSDELGLFAYDGVGPLAAYQPDPYRSSDHDPLLVGLDLP